MEIRIGILNAPRELSFDTESSAEEVVGSVTSALDSGATQVTLKDQKGDTYIVPVANIAYVELGSAETRRVGFVG